MSLKKLIYLCCCLALVLCAASSQSLAQKFHGGLEVPEQLVERGFFIGPDFGLLFVINNDTPVNALGFITGVTMGYDFGKYISALALTDFAIVQAGPELKGGINMFFLNGGARGTYPVTERFWPFLRFLGGYFFTDPNIKDAANQAGTAILPNVPTKAANFWFGGGFVYYMAKRHFSFELSFDYVYINDIPLDALNLSGSLRYTF